VEARGRGAAGRGAQKRSVSSFVVVSKGKLSTFREMRSDIVV